MDEVGPTAKWDNFNFWLATLADRVNRAKRELRHAKGKNRRQWDRELKDAQLAYEQLKTGI